MKKAGHTRRKGFTLIELLIVIAILGVLAVALLLTINPGEAQKKSRDVKRASDIKTLTTIVDQYINDGNTPPAGNCLLNAAGCTSTGAPSGSQPCNANWINLDVCRYANTLPTDPNNGSSRTVVTGTGTTGARTTIYRAAVNGSDYEITVRQESVANQQKVIGDGGNSTEWLEAGSSLTLLGN